LIAGGVVIVCIAFAVVLLLIKALWAWTVSDLFPGAVQQGLVAGSISWLTAAKVALFIAVLSGLFRGGQARTDKKELDLEPSLA